MTSARFKNSLHIEMILAVSFAVFTIPSCGLLSESNESITLQAAIRSKSIDFSKKTLLVEIDVTGSPQGASFEAGMSRSNNILDCQSADIQFIESKTVPSSIKLEGTYDGEANLINRLICIYAKNSKGERMPGDALSFMTGLFAESPSPAMPLPPESAAETPEPVPQRSGPVRP